MSINIHENRNTPEAGSEQIKNPAEEQRVFLDLEKDRDAHKRAKQTVNHIHILIIALLYLFALAFLVIASVRLGHFIEIFSWLKDDKLKQMDTFLTYLLTSALGGTIGTYLKKSLE